MLKNYNEQIQLSVRLLDVLITVLAFFLAFHIRSSDWMGGAIGSLDSVTWMLAASVVTHFFLYPSLGFYQSLRLKRVSEILSMILRAMVAEFFVLGTLVFLVQAKTTSRYFFGLFICLNYAGLLIEKVGVRGLLSLIRRRGYNYRRVLVVGDGENAKRVIDVLTLNKHWGYVVRGILAEGPRAGLRHGVEVLGSLSDLEAIVRKETVDEVYFAPDRLEPELISREVDLCQRLGIPARFSLSLFETPLSKVTFSQIGSLPVITFYTTLRTPLEAALKRLMDIAVAIIGLGMTAVLYPWISWKIRRQSPGPVIFKQVRVGENGRRFKCYKFRTMQVGAEGLKEELRSRNQMSGPIFKLESDPRVFPFGAFLRSTSLDELPQFFNILRGDMSVVGTRPPTPDEVNQYETYYRRRLSIKPGLTGLWQVSGRSRITRFEDILELDLKYIDEWSLWVDLQIIARTIWVTVFRRGAM